MPVLSACKPIEVNGLNWAILAEIDPAMAGSAGGLPNGDSLSPQPTHDR